ncbi:hypothetical protein FPSM_00162 [Flavobacterium psychrophilum]|nr:hypothetical protein FPSM_00162 [Flavobacterium psychrophilum]
MFDIVQKLQQYKTVRIKKILCGFVRKISKVD